MFQSKENSVLMGKCICHTYRYVSDKRTIKEEKR